MPITGGPLDFGVRVRAYRSTDQLITRLTWTAISFDNQRWDDPDNNQWAIAPNPTRLTCQYDGSYPISGNVAWAAETVGVRYLAIRLNGTDFIALTSAINLESEYLFQNVGTDWKMVVGDFVELMVYQSSGGNLLTLADLKHSPEFAMSRCV